MARLRVVRAAPFLARVIYSPPSADVEVGQTVQFSAAGVDQYGDAFPITGAVWATDNPAVASVDANGLASGLAVGEVEVTVSVNGQTFA